MQRRRIRNTLKLHLSARLHWTTVCYWSPSEHDVILRIHHCCACSFLSGWPPCQRSDMTLVEVSQHAYNYLFIRNVVLFVFLRNSCEPDLVLVYFCWINSVWVCLSLIIKCDRLSIFVNIWQIPREIKHNKIKEIKNNAWVTVNNDFWVTSEAICQWFSRVTKSRVKIIGKSHHEWPKNRYSR